MLVYIQMIDAPEEKDKFERLYLKYRDLMFYIANKILQNQQDAEDAVHAAFLSIAENMEKLSQAISQLCETSWMFTKDPARNFTRERKLPLREVISVLLCMEGGTCHALLQNACIPRGMHAFVVGIPLRPMSLT